MDQDLQVYHSTNPTGENQPGYARVGHCLPPRDLRTHSDPETRWHKRIADVVMYDPTPQLYTVVAEIKSGDVGGLGCTPVFLLMHKYILYRLIHYKFAAKRKCYTNGIPFKSPF